MLCRKKRKKQNKQTKHVQCHKKHFQCTLIVQKRQDMSHFLSLTFRIYFCLRTMSRRMDEWQRACCWAMTLTQTLQLRNVKCYIIFQLGFGGGADPIQHTKTSRPSGNKINLHTQEIGGWEHFAQGGKIIWVYCVVYTYLEKGQNPAHWVVMYRAKGTKCHL